MRIGFSIARLAFFISTLLVFEKTMATDPVGGTTPSVVSVSASAEAQNAKLSAVRTNIDTVVQSTGAAMLTLALKEIQFIRTDYEKYLALKKKCAGAADTAETMCLESKNEDAIKTKKLLDLAGPALGMISSAQKACSETASVMDIAKLGFAAAQGACTAAKIACDMSCASAAKDLAALVTRSKEFVGSGLSEIEEKWALGPEAYALANQAKIPIQSFGTIVSSQLAAEQAPAPIGTVGSIVKKCESHALDLLLFAANIATVVKANASAKECAKKLSNGNGSAAEYCKLPANSATTFCVCFKDNKAEGCPGFVAKANDPNKFDETGKDIKDTGKGNQFATVFDNVKPQNIDVGKINSDQNKVGDAGKDPDSKGAGGGSGSPSGGGSSGASGGGAGGGHDAKDAVGSGDKKKWSFGSFAGGSGGSATGGSGGGYKGSEGGLGQKEMDALQRQIASEKIRAEVSGASGKSNWEKVNERYLSNSSTLISGK